MFEKGVGILMLDIFQKWNAGGKYLESIHSEEENVRYRCPYLNKIKLMFLLDFQQNRD